MCVCVYEVGGGIERKEREKDKSWNYTPKYRG